MQNLEKLNKAAQSHHKAIYLEGAVCLDTPLGPQLHKPNRLSEPGRVMGASPDTHRG
jgi:hypothetical protein